MSTTAPTDDLDLLSRLACFGSEDGTFHVLNKRDYPIERVESVKSVLSMMNRGPEVVKRLKTIANQRSYVTKENLLFSLAAVINSFGLEGTDHKTDKLSNEAYRLVQELCESPSDLFTFIHYDKKVRQPSKVSWGRGMRALVTEWYTSKSADDLVQHVTRCKSRHGFSHKDLIKLSHLKCEGLSKGTELIIQYIMKGRMVLEKAQESPVDDKEMEKVAAVLQTIERLMKSSVSDKELIRNLIDTFKLCSMQIPCHLMKTREVFEGMLGHTSMNSLLKSIPKMAALGLLDPMSSEAEKVLDRLNDTKALQEERVSPVTVFIAMRRYDVNKDKKWIRNMKVAQSLHFAYDASLETMPKTGKRYLLAVHIDDKIAKTCVTGSASVLSPIMPCAIMAQILAQVEANPEFVYFKSTAVTELNFTSSQPTVAVIEQILKETKDSSNGTYDICQPIKWATDQKKTYDCILIISGKKRVTSHADLKDAIAKYRWESGVTNAKVAIVGLSDPTPYPDRDDINFLDVTGFDEEVPGLLQKFCQGLPW